MHEKTLKLAVGFLDAQTTPPPASTGVTNHPSKVVVLAPTAVYPPP